MAYATPRDSAWSADGVTRSITRGEHRTNDVRLCSCPDHATRQTGRPPVTALKSGHSPYIKHGLRPHGYGPAVRSPDPGEAVLTSAGALVQLVDHRLQLSPDLHGGTVDERDRARGHDDTLPADAAGAPSRG